MIKIRSMKAISLSKTVLVLLITMSIQNAIAQSETQNPTGGAGVFWKLQGNTGTTPGTHFVGTTDAKDLVFKTQGSEKMRIVNSTGNVGIGTTNAQERLHVAGNVLVANNNGYMGVNTSGVSAPMLKIIGNEIFMGDFVNTNYAGTRIVSSFDAGGFISIDDALSNSMIYARNSDRFVG